MLLHSVRRSAAHGLVRKRPALRSSFDHGALARASALGGAATATLYGARRAHALSSAGQGEEEEAGRADRGLLEYVQRALLSVHAHAGGDRDENWWKTIVLSTVLTRAALLPLVSLSANASHNLAEAGPALAKLNGLYAQEMKKISLMELPSAAANTERAKAFGLYWKGLGQTFRLYKVRPLRILAAPVMHIGALMVFIFAMRRSVGAGAERKASPLISRGEFSAVDGDAAEPPARERPPGTLPGMERGGALWFEDLTSEDATYRLPAAALLLTYANIEMGLAVAARGSGFVKAIQDIMQMAMIVMAPSIATLPSGVFVYWITSGAWTAAQRLALTRFPAARRLLRIPPLKAAP